MYICCILTSLLNMFLWLLFRKNFDCTSFWDQILENIDHKTWLWRKKPSEKIIVAIDKIDQNEEEKEVHLEGLVKNLNETLTSILRDCNAKDDLVANLEKRAQEASSVFSRVNCLLLLSILCCYIVLFCSKSPTSRGIYLRDSCYCHQSTEARGDC